MARAADSAAVSSVRTQPCLYGTEPLWVSPTPVCPAGFYCPFVNITDVRGLG